MIEFEIGETKNCFRPVKETPHKIKLALVPCSSEEGVTVVMIDEDGTTALCGHLLTFTSDGMIRLCGSISRDAGFLLDDDGRIQIKKDII